MSREKTLELKLDFGEDGRKLRPVSTVDYETNETLIVGSINKEALEKTIETGYATYWSTSRNELWTKGLTSGDLLKIREIRVNCEQTSYLYIADIVGNGACHSKDENGRTRKSCFYRRINNGKLEYV